MKKFSVRDLILIALFAALLAVLSQLAIPLPSGVPITLQTFAVALCGFTLGTKKGAIAVVVYLLLGAIGLPVFSHFMGGIGIFAGVTGGFLWGFIILAALCGTQKLYWAALGLVLCHLLGTIQFSIVAGMTFTQSFLLSSAPFLIKDGISVVLAMFVSRAIQKGLAAARLASR